MLMAQEQPKKVVFIILDGISYDVISHVNTPHIDRIAQEGGFTKAYVGGERGGYSETPTISAVGYNSLLTGTWVNKHNVFGNDIRRPNYNYWTIFRLLKEERPDAKLAIFSTWLDNRTKLLGEGLEETNQLELDYSFDGFEIDTIAFPHDAEKRYIFEIDEKVSKEAARYIAQEGPDLSWVYLEYPDDMGHRYGDSPQLYQAVEEADRQTGLIYDAVLERIAMGEDWLIVVTTDHGRQPTTGLHHGGQSDREREIWISTNAKSLNKHFQSDSVAIVDILPTMIRHLEINPTESQLNEMDGVALTGEISLRHPKVIRNQNDITFQWEFLGQDDEDIQIWVAIGNQFRTTGQNDNFRHLSTVKGRLGELSLPIEDFDQEQFKAILIGKHNRVNKWLVKQKTND